MNTFFAIYFVEEDGPKVPYVIGVEGRSLFDQFIKAFKDDCEMKEITNEQEISFAKKDAGIITEATIKEYDNDLWNVLCDCGTAFYQYYGEEANAGRGGDFGVVVNNMDYYRGLVEQGLM